MTRELSIQAFFDQTTNPVTYLVLECENPNRGGD